MIYLGDLRLILGINDTTKDDLLELYINKAVVLIRNYLKITNQTIDISSVYQEAIIEYVTESYRKRGNEGLKSFGQGSRSGTYESGLSDSVKALLPAPYVRMRG